MELVLSSKDLPEAITCNVKKYGPLFNLFYTTNELTISDLYNEIMNYPIESDEFDRGQKLISDLLFTFENEKYSKYILCLRNRWDSISPNALLLNDAQNPFLSSLPKLHDHKTFNDCVEWSFCKRGHVEYDCRNKQICVGMFIHIIDTGKYIVLESLKGRFKGKYTLIQGHVDFDKTAYILSQKDFLYKNISREYIEEIKSIDTVTYFQTDESPKYVISTYTDFTSLEHIGYIYVLEVSQCDADKICSNEPDKHKVHIVDNEFFSSSSNIDEWLMTIYRNEKRTI
jgi:hypothetical protein